MDSNKEEALRAKGIAKKKMESKDFIGACTIALKAQKLYPDLENIAQMLVVCDVHCSAEQKLLDNTKMVDWYKVLQVDRNDNDVIIKKQNTKFALQLHPDKNKFTGAEAAFKLIGEAQRVLLDREKRSSLNMSLSSFSMNRTAMPSHHQQNVPVNFNPVMQTNVRPVFPNLNPQQQQQSRQPTQQGVNGGVQSPTFWTMCSFCSVKFEYYRAVLNRSIRCQQCSKPFIAYEMDPQSTKPATNSSQNRQPIQQNNTPNHGAFKFCVGSQSNVFAKRPKKESHHKKGSTSNVSVKPNGKRKKEYIYVSSTDSEDDTLLNNNGFPGVPTSRDERPRRSTRQKHHVSYKENQSDSIDDNGSDESEIRRKSQRTKNGKRKMNMDFDTTQKKISSMNKKAKKCTTAETNVASTSQRRKSSTDKGGVTNNNNPSFELKLRPSYAQGYLFRIPSGFSKKYMKGFNGTASLRVVGKNEIWKLSVKYGRVTKYSVVTGGWYSFTKDNNLQIGDVCKFKMTQAEPFIFTVTIIRAGEETRGYEKSTIEIRPGQYHPYVPKKLLSNGEECIGKSLEFKVGGKSWSIKVIRRQPRSVHFSYSFNSICENESRV